MAGGILITGGAGFLGSALAAALGRGQRVVLLDALCHDPVQQRRRAALLGAELIEADVADRAALERALDGCARVVHLASLAGVERVCADPVATMRTLLLGSSALLDACRERPGIERVLLVSSSEVYGPRADRPPEEAVAAPLPAGEPRWSYAAAKLAAEHLALAHQRSAGLPVCVLRPFNVYGPGQLGAGAVRIFAERALAGRPLAIRGDGRQLRAWCHVDDLVAGLRAALFAEAAVGRVYNLGNPAAQATVRALAERIVALAGSTSRLVHVAPAAAEVSHRVPEIARARRELGFAPRIELDRGLRHTLDWLRCGRADAPGPPPAAGEDPCAPS